MNSAALLLLTFFLSPAYLGASVSDDFLNAAAPSFGVDAIGASKDKAPQKNNLDNKIDMTATASVSAQKVCREEQKIIPAKVLYKLMARGELLVKNRPERQSMSFHGGAMVSNCNSMLSFEFKNPTDGGAYSFFAKVKKPATGCEKQASGEIICEYKVSTANEDGAANKDLLKINVEPSYSGFISCLKKTGVFDGKKFNQKKQVLLDFKYDTPPGVNRSAPLHYYCQGRLCNVSKFKINPAIKSRRQGNSCQHFEDIKKGGHRFISLAEIKRNRKQAKFNEICNSGDYKFIESYLPDFAQGGIMHKILVKVRNQALKKKIKILHKKLNRKSYAKLQVKDFDPAVKDFYNKIILPQRKRVAKLVALVDNFNEDDPRKKKATKALNQAVEDLVALASDEYLTRDDYEKMLDFKRNGPIEKDGWRDAALHLFAINNTAYHFSRYKPKYEKKYKLDHALRAEDTLSLIEEEVTKEQDRINKIGVLANDYKGRVSYAHDYKSAAESILIDHRNEIAYTEEDLFYEKQYEKNTCYNAQGGMTGLVRYNCIADSRRAQEEMAYRMEELASPEYKQAAIYPRVQHRMELSNEWAKIENDRNKLYRIAPRSRSSNLSGDPRIYKRPDFSQRLARQQQRRRQLPYPGNGGEAYRWNSQSRRAPIRDYSYPRSFNRAPSNYINFESGYSQRRFFN